MNAAERNAALCAAWLERQAKRCAPLTVRQYAQRLDKLVQWAGARSLGELTLRDLEAWTSHPKEPRPRAGEAGVEGVPRADGSIDRDVVIVRGLYKWAFANGIFSTNPALELRAAPVRNHNPRALDDALWQKVWTSDFSDSMRVCLGLGYYCGLRREEICRLTAEHWDAKRGRLIHFRRKGDRNSKTTGVLPVVSCAHLYAEKRPELIGDPDAFLRPLQAAVRSAKPFLLPWGQDRVATSVRFDEGQTNPDQINSRLSYLLPRLGLPARCFAPHDLRHSFVTNMLDMGVPIHEVSVLANHSSIAITQRYARVSEDPLARYLSDNPLAARWRR